MTTAQVLKEIRRRLGNVSGILDPISLEYQDDFLLEYVQSALDYLFVMTIVDVEYTLVSSEITPEPSTIDGLLVAAYVSFYLLSGDVQYKVRSGELGTRFKSGQDEISTVEAARLITNIVDMAEKEYRRLVMAKKSPQEANAERLT